MITLGRAFGFAAAVAGFTLVGTAQADDAPAATDQVTYSGQVAQILFSNCVSCHRPGQIGPMSFMSHKETRPWAKAIKKAVTEGAMPPWFSDNPMGHFKNDTRLTAEEVATLAKWADQGAPLGDPAAMPPTPVFAGGWNIGEPDHIFVMEPFQVTDEMEDHYQYVSIKNPLSEDKWVKAVEIKPGLAEAVHHNLVFVGPEGMRPQEIENKLDLFAKWGPGNNPDVYPEGHGKLLPANSTILFQLHYHKEPGPGTGGIDQSKMAVKFADGPVEHPVTTAWILNPMINIPAGATGYEAASTFRFIDDGVIYSLAPHMHLRGKSFQYIAEYPDGTKEVLLNVPKWDFNWQISYYLNEPKHVPRGTKIHATAQYDNSTNNPHNPNPNVNVTWGEATTEEMMIGFMDYIYDKRKNFQRTFALPENMEGVNFFEAFSGGDGDHDHNEVQKSGGGE